MMLRRTPGALLAAAALSLVSFFAVGAEDPPQTTITQTPPDPSGRNSVFYYTGDESSGPVTGYECRVDTGTWYACNSVNVQGPHVQVGPLSPGMHTFEVRAINAYGPDATPASHSWTVAEPPNTTITSGPPAFTSVNSASFTFTSSDGGVNFLCQIDAQSSWDPCQSPYTYTNLNEGSHTFRVYGGVNDTDDTPATHTWVVDRIAPDTTITSGPSGTVTAAEATFSYQSSEPGDLFECALDGGAWYACANGSTSVTVSPGTHTLAVRAIDRAGNIDSTSATRTWTYIAAPDTTITSGPAGSVASRNATFTYASSASGASFQCEISGPGLLDPFQNCPATGKSYSGLINGVYTFKVRSAEGAGPYDPTPAAQSWTVSMPPPETTITSGPPAVTNSRYASFSYSSDQAGVQFVCNLDNQGWAMCLTQYGPLNEGTHTLLAAAIFGGRESEMDPTPASRTWNIDLTPPSMSITAGPSGTVGSRTATFEFAGNESGMRFYCQLDELPYGECTSPTTYTGLADGNHLFQVAGFDLAMNGSGVQSRSWQVDGTVPDTTIDGGPSGTVALATAQFTFTSSAAGATFECRLDGASFAPCTSPATYSGLADGSHTFEVRARVATGNVDPTPAAASWSVDTTFPDTAILSGPSGATATSSASFTFESTDTAASFECSLDSGPFTACSSGASYSGLGEGMHLFEVRSRDAAGNVDATPASRTWSVDLTQPGTTITSGPAVITASASATFEFTSTEPGAFLCSLDGAPFSSCVSPVSYAVLAAGSHSFSVYAVDSAGNGDSSAATWSWIVDTDAPETTITSAPSGTTTATSASIAFSSEPGASFECSLDAAAFAACTSPVTLSGVSEGAHTFQVRARDAAGNADATPAVASWTVDTTPPQTSISSAPPAFTNSTAATISFSSEAGATFECKLDGGAYAPCTSPQAYSGLAVGSHTFSVRARDAVGNTDATPASATWTIDTTAPNTTIASGPSGNNNPQPVTFTFTSSEPNSTFECRMDTAAFAACTSPASYSALAKGQHTFQVRARDPAGNLDASPASRNFGVK